MLQRRPGAQLADDLCDLRQADVIDHFLGWTCANFLLSDFGVDDTTDKFQVCESFIPRTDRRFPLNYQDVSRQMICMICSPSYFRVGVVKYA